MSDPFDLERFIRAQEGVFDTALAELRSGRKESHWMWFVFPQLAGLGRSATAQYFGIGSRDEARVYVAHPVLGPRLRLAVHSLEAWAGKRSAEQILGAVDAMKLHSSLTLFDLVEPAGPFGTALAKFYGEPDPRTLALMQQLR